METEIMTGNLISEAADFAIEAHKNQIDDDKLPHFIHTGKVAELVSKLNNKAYVIAAAWLHDVLEDCPDVTYERLVYRFGKVVADLVREVTKDKKTKTYPFLETPEGYLIKFIDRAHNLSRMQCWDAARQERYMKESRFW
jgi:(p)ppGpp synthase/HD superfamily hydrolase